MSDNIYVLQESSSEYETSSEDEEEEEKVKVVQQPMKFYEHTNYVDNIVKVLPVIIEVDRSTMTPSGTAETDRINFTISFDDSIIIHKLCDIYLDNIVTFNCEINTQVGGSGGTEPINMNFLLDIKELDINTISSKSIMKNKIVIPNGSAGAKLTVTTHRNKKMNFISTIQPKIINTFTGSLTDLDGKNIWHSGDTSQGRFSLELNFIFRN